MGNDAIKMSAGDMLVILVGLTEPRSFGVETLWNIVKREKLVCIFSFIKSGSRYDFQLGR